MFGHYMNCQIIVMNKGETVIPQSQPNEKLVLHFSELILKQKQDEGLRIFSDKPFDLKLAAVSSTKLLKRIRCGQ